MKGLVKEAVMRRQREKALFEEWFDDSLAADPAFAARVEKRLAEMNIEQELIALRLQRGLTQADLGRKLGISQPAVAKLEAGGGNWELKTLARAAEALQVRLEIRFVSSGPAARLGHTGERRPRENGASRVHPGVIAEEAARYRSATSGRMSTRGKPARPAAKKK